MFRLKLYIATQSEKTTMHALKLRQEIVKRSGADCELEIIDILMNPEACEEDLIFVTPTIVRCRPLPIMKIIGDISNIDLITTALECNGTD